MTSRPARAVGSALSHQVLSTECFDIADSAALFVGVRLFRDGQYAEVPSAVDDAVDLAHTFVNLGLVTPDKTLLCLHGEARKPESAERLAELKDLGAKQRKAGVTDIYDALDRQRIECGEHGIFLVGVASHGMSHQGRDLVLAADTVPSQLLRTSVEVTEIFKTVGMAKAPRRLVLLDACRERLEAEGRSATGGESGSPMSDTFAKAIAKASGQVVLSGTVSGGYSYDDTHRGNGVFSAAVIDGLSGKAPGDERNLITVETLAAFVEDQVQDWLAKNAKDLLGIGKNFDGMCKDMPLAAAFRQAVAAPPSTTAEDRYRQEVREYLDNNEISPIERKSLDEDRVELGLSVDIAEAIEAEEMSRAASELAARLDRYVETVKVAIEEYGYPVPDSRRQELKKRQAKLRLEDDDVADAEERVASALGLAAADSPPAPVVPSELGDSAFVVDEDASPEELTHDDPDVTLDALLDRVKDDDDARQQFVDLLELMGPDDVRTAMYRKLLTSRLFAEPEDPALDDHSALLATAPEPVSADAGWAGAEQQDDLLSMLIEAQILAQETSPPGDVDLAECGMVTTVVPGSPAERLGVIAGDILIAVNGIPAGDLGGSLHQTGLAPTQLEFRTVRRGHLSVETTGVEPGFEFSPTPEAIMADRIGFDDAGNFRRLWDLDEKSRLWTLCLRSAAATGSSKVAKHMDSTPDEVLEMFDRGWLPNDDLCLLYLGGLLLEAGEPRGVELVSKFINKGMDSYTQDHHIVASYYLAIADAEAPTPDDAIAALEALHRRSGFDRIASTLRRLGGNPCETTSPGRVGMRFPIPYDLQVLGERRTISLVETLAGMHPHQLHVVCMMGPYRSNGPYHDALFGYQNLAQHLPEFVTGLHVLTSKDGRPDRWTRGWLGQEQAVRDEGLPIDVLFDEDDEVIEAVGSTGAPDFLMLDCEGIIQLDGSFAEGVWTALQRLLRQSA